MIKPLYNNILIKVINEDSVTAQGLIIKGNQSDNIKIGEIVKVSDDVNNNFIKEKIKIIFKVSESNRFFYNNQSYFLIECNKILGILE